VLPAQGVTQCRAVQMRLHPALPSVLCSRHCASFNDVLFCFCLSVCLPVCLSVCLPVTLGTKCHPLVLSWLMLLRPYSAAPLLSTTPRSRPASPATCPSCQTVMSGPPRSANTDSSNSSSSSITTTARMAHMAGIIPIMQEQQLGSTWGTTQVGVERQPLQQLLMTWQLWYLLHADGGCPQRDLHNLPLPGLQVLAGAAGS